MIEQVIILGLAAYRVAFFLVEESGPFDCVEKFRSFAGVKPGLQEDFLPQLFSCIFCMSVWTVLLAYFLWQIEPMIVAVIAAMALPVLFEKYYAR